MYVIVIKYDVAGFWSDKPGNCVKCIAVFPDPFAPD